MENNTEKYLKAKEQVHKIKGFYTHLAIYLIVNTLITGINIYYSNFKNIHFNMFSTWIYWGIGILFHAMGVFRKNILLSTDWEERKIQELMDEENEIRF